MKNLNIYPNINELLKALAEKICAAAEESIEKRGRFNFVLSGGNSPKKLYELLASEEFENRIEWEKVFFFFGDERFVPDNDSRRNSAMAEKALFEPLGIKDERIFKVDTSSSPEQAAEKYIRAINEHFYNLPVEFDFILLGLGDDAHTASLFPKSSVLEETDATIKSIFIDQAKMYRVTMTAPLINNAREIVFLVFGNDKADAVFHVLNSEELNVNQYPAKLITKDSVKVQWFLDRASAANLGEI